MAFTQYPASVILVTSASGSDFFEDFSDDEGEPEEEEDEEAVEDAEEEETEDTDEAGGLAIAGAASPSKGELKYKNNDILPGKTICLRGATECR